MGPVKNKKKHVGPEGVQVRALQNPIWANMVFIGRRTNPTWRRANPYLAHLGSQVVQVDTVARTT